MRNPLTSSLLLSSKLFKVSILIVNQNPVFVSFSVGLISQYIHKIKDYLKTIWYKLLLVKLAAVLKINW